MKQIFRIFTLIAVAMLTAGQAWAGSTADLGFINIGTVSGGMPMFYKEATCEHRIYTNSNLSSSDLTDGKVYIKATPYWNYTAVEVTITAQVSISSSSLEARAITRGTEIGIGEAITVNPVSGKPGIYSFTMPTDGKNVTVSATFKEKVPLTGVSYIDPTQTGDARNATTPAGTNVYILDGSEVVLGEGNENPTWYVCNSTSGLSYKSALMLNGDVHLILADNAKMTMDVVNDPAILSRGDFYIYGQSDNSGKLIATSDKTGISIDGNLYVNGGQLKATGSTGIYNTSGTTGAGIVAKNDITITGGQVTATGSGTNGYGILSLQGGVTISGGQVTATGSGTNGYGIRSLQGGVTISGGQVIGSGTNYGIISRDIVLGWTNASDYIKASSYNVSAQGAVKIAAGKRFVAYNMASESDISANCIIGDATSTDATALANGISLDDATAAKTIAGKTLKPLDGYTVTVADGISVGTLSGTTFTAADPDFTITTDAGTENKVTTPYYIYKASTQEAPVTVTLKATDSNKQLGSVEITGATATQGDGTFTFTIGESDVTVTAATFLEKVTYIDPTAEGDNKTKTVFATPLTGSETTLGTDNTEMWYVVSDDVSYNTAHQDDIYILDVKGNVSIILADGKTMTVDGTTNTNNKKGFILRDKAKLTIYGQGGSTEGSLIINSGTAGSVEANGVVSNEVIICGGNVTTDHGIANYGQGKFTIYGGSFKDTRETDASYTAINAGAITINGGTVSAANSLLSQDATGDGFGDITINGGVVNVNNLLAYKGNVIINGGQVKTLGNNNNAIWSMENITLGWTNAATDKIEATGTYYCKNGTLSIAKALMTTGDGAQVFSGSIANNNFTLNDINGKTLKPALKINLPTNVTVTATGTNVVTSETAGIYAIYRANVKLSGTAPAGQTLTCFTVKDADNNAVRITEDNEFTMPAMAVTVTANLTNIPATAPTISTQPSNLNLEWGYNSGNVLTVSASAATSHVLSYQWYSNSSNSTTGGTKIQSATSNSYTVPTGKNAGTTEYYYCVVTAKRSDNSETAQATSNVATVTVEAKNVAYSGGTITQDENGYTVNLTEGTGSANPLPNDAALHSLTYSRTLTPPGSGKGDVTIGGQAAKLYTVCLPFAPKTGTGVKYYTLSSVSGQTVSFEEVTSPAANTPYLVAVTGSTNITESCMSEVVTSTTINSTTKDGYTFTGTFTGLEHAQAVGKHILQSENEWCVVENSGSVFIPPFRAYIESASGARVLTGSFDDDATGIQNILTVDRDGTERWYDLNGRRIDQPAKKGIYIRNGKKEIRK